MLIKTIRWLYYLLFFVTPVLMNPHTSEIFEFNKIIFVYAITIIIATVWLIKKILYQETFKLHWFLYPCGLFLLSQLASTVFSIDLQTSLFGYYGRFNGGLLSIIAYLTLFYIFYDIFNKEYLITFLKISVFASLIVILWGIPGKFGADLSCLLFTGTLSNSCWTAQFQPAERMFSTLGQPNWLGAYLAIHFFIGFYFFIKSITLSSKTTVAPRRDQMVYGLYVVLVFLTLLFTRSRSSLGAVAISLVLVSYLYFWQLRKIIHKRLLVKVGVLGISFILLVLIFQTGIAAIDQQLGSITQIFVNNDDQFKPSQQQSNPTIIITDSLDIRKIVWDGAIELGKQYPIFGTGVETFAYVYYFVRPTEHNLTSEWDFIYNKAHNEFLNYLATTGFLGLLTYSLVILGVIYVYIMRIITSLSEEKILYISLFGAYSTILITNFFGFSTTTINLFFYILPAIPLLSEKTDHSPVKRKGVLLEAASYVVVGMGLLLMWTLFRYYLADLSYARGNRHIEADEYQEAMNAYSDALDLKYEHVYEDRLSGTLANLGIIAYLQEEEDLSKRLIDLSKAYNQKTRQAAPKNVLYWKTKAKNDYLFYQAEKDKAYLNEAIEALQVAEKIAPTDPKIPYTIALFYTDLYQDEQEETVKVKYHTLATQYVDKSLTLKPNYIDSLELQKELSGL